jgi:hypothetical protein
MTIRNESLKMLATAFNNLGVGGILTGIVAPFVHNELHSWWAGGSWLGGGVIAIGLAQTVLRGLR